MRLTWGIAGALLCVSWLSAHADDQVQTIARGARNAIESIPIDVRPREFSALLDGPLERLRIASESKMPLTVVGKIPRAAMDEAREIGPGAKSDLEEVLEVWNLNGLGDSAEARLPRAEYDSLSAAIRRIHQADLKRAKEDNDRWLHAFDVKYGEGAPKLNVVEVVVNGLAQSSRLFRPSRQAPSPNEIILAYNTAWATIVEDEAKAISAIEAGWRRYRFSWKAKDSSDWTGILKPRYWAIGVLVAPPGDGALRWPFDALGSGDTRVGPFLSWGDIKVGAVFGNEDRFVVTRQLQLLPGLF